MQAALELNSLPAPSPLRRHRALLLLALLAASLAAPLRYLHFVNLEMPSTHSDLVDEWVGVRDALQGKDPYSPSGMRDTQIAYYGRPLTPADHVDPQGFPYPAHFVVLFAPLALLSWPAARLFFLLTILPALALSLWLCIRSLNLPLSRKRSALIVFLTLCSWPVVWGLRLQQPTLFVVIMVFSGCYLLSRNRDGAAGILLSIATVKPQLVLPLLAWLFLWSALHHRWKFPVSFLAASAVLLGAAELVMPGWLPHWLRELNGYKDFHGALPLQYFLGHWAGLCTTLVMLLWAALQLWRMRACSARSVEFAVSTSLALALALCCTLTKPATLYNQIALLPAVLLLFFAKPRGSLADLFRRLALALVVWEYLSLLIAAAGEGVFGAHDFWMSLPFQNVLLPIVVTVGLILAASALAAGKPAADLFPSLQRSRQETFAPRHTYDAAFYRYIQEGSTRSAEVIVPLLAAHLPIDSVLDVGCGAGAWLAVYRRRQLADCVGVDGDYVASSSLLIPPATFEARDVSRPFQLGRRFSLVQCLEVAEHIDPSCSETLVANLVAHGDCVLFSAGVPGQGGENHVNERPLQYWRCLFAAHGYLPFDCVRPRIRDARNVEKWYRQNTILYVSGQHAVRLAPEIASTFVPEDAPLADFSDLAWRMRTRILAPLPISWVTRLSVLRYRLSLLSWSPTEAPSIPLPAQAGRRD